MPLSATSSSLLGAGLGLAQPITGALIAGLAGPLERKYRKQAWANYERTSGGRGGYSAGQMQQRMAEGQGMVQRQEQQALANAMRGASPEGRAQAQAGIMKAGAGARAAEMSGLRQASLQQASAERGAAQQDIASALRMAQARKFAAANIVASPVMGSATQAAGAGIAQRFGTAKTVEQGAETL